MFADRGVYRLGEEVHYKAILRHDTATGIKVPDAGTPVYVSVRDSQDREVDQRDGEAVGVGLGRVDAHAAGRRRARQLLGADAAAARSADAAKKPSAELVRELNVENEVEGEAEGAAAARLDQRRLPGRRLSPARLPRRRHADQRDAVRRHAR